MTSFLNLIRICEPAAAVPVGEISSIQLGSGAFGIAETAGDGVAALFGPGFEQPASEIAPTTEKTIAETHRMTILLRASSSVARRLIVTALAVVILLAGYALRPLRPAPLPRDARALEFVDRNGLFLGSIIGRGEGRTVAVPLERVAPSFVRAVLAVEDERFFAHGAVDGIAAARALLRAPFDRRLGGASTLSMQVGRLIEPVSPSWLGKVQEIVLAQRLENGLSKRAILEEYCNRAPMGSNVYGVEAAARVYFGVEASQLDLAQSSILAALPNDPVRLDPYRHWQALKARQRYVLGRLRAVGAIGTTAAELAFAEHVALRPEGAGIVAAPHYLFHVLPSVADGVARVQTTLDRPLQQFVEAQVVAVVRALARNDVHHAAAIVIDNRTGDVLAYAGSPNYFADDDLGRNDGVQALRQPGSALKPFLYELALERREIRPNTILADVPTAYALPEARVYEPADYSNRFLGPVRVRVALADSLNVPAVRVLERVGVEPFRERHNALGFVHLTKPAEYYGLGLTLGGGEVTLEELARAYAIAAQKTEAGDPAWALVTDILADPHARAASFGVDSILALPFPAAVKTGTSSDFRDTWTAGYTRDYTVAVWVGNFDGSPMREISGVTGAGPLWARIMLELYKRGEPPPFAPPAGYVRKPICAETGLRPTADCRAVVSELLDDDDVRRWSVARVPAPVRSREYAGWLVNQPERARMPTRVLFPRDGDVFVYDAAGGSRERLQFEIAGPHDASLAVALNGRPIVPVGGDYLWALRPGSYELSARSRAGFSRVRFTVAPSSPLRSRTGFSVIAPG
jgi:penicillin-binding protein 1C